MQYSAKDIEIFVLTYNRADFLSETLESVLAQTEKGFRLVVLDNGSNDHTLEVMNKYKQCDVEYIKRESNEGVEANFRTAKEMASRSWTIIFHDDDLLHPEYISDVLKAVNEDEDLVIVGSNMLCERHPKSNWKTLKGGVRKFNKVSDFAAFLFNGHGYHFGSTVYRTDLFKKVPVRWDLYGKIADRPFLYDIAAYGSVKVFTEPYVKYRLHPGQDIKRGVPHLDHVFALRKKYFDLLGDNIFSKSGRILIANSYKGIRSEVSYHKGINLKEYLKLALDKGGLSKRALVIGKIVFPVIYMRDQFRRAVKRVATCYNS